MMQLAGKGQRFQLNGLKLVSLISGGVQSRFIGVSAPSFQTDSKVDQVDPVEASTKFSKSAFAKADQSKANQQKAYQSKTNQQKAYQSKPNQPNANHSDTTQTKPRISKAIRRYEEQINRFKKLLSSDNSLQERPEWITHMHAMYTFVRKLNIIDELQVKLLLSTLYRVRSSKLSPSKKAEAENLLDRILYDLQQNIIPSTPTIWAQILKTLTHYQLIEKANGLWEEMRSWPVSQSKADSKAVCSEAYAAAIELLTSQQSPLEDCEELLQECTTRNIQPCPELFSSTILLYLWSNLDSKAYNYFTLLVKSFPEYRTSRPILLRVARWSRPSQFKKVLAWSLESKQIPDVFLMNTIIKSARECLDIPSLLQVYFMYTNYKGTNIHIFDSILKGFFDQFAESDMLGVFDDGFLINEPDINSNEIWESYLKNPIFQDICDQYEYRLTESFKEPSEVSLPPSIATPNLHWHRKKFTTFVEIFLEVCEKRLGIQPTVVTYTTLLQGFLEFETMDSFNKVIRAMDSKGMEFDSVTYRALLKTYIKRPAPFRMVCNNWQGLMKINSTYPYRAHQHNADWVILIKVLKQRPQTQSLRRWTYIQLVLASRRYINWPNDAKIIELPRQLVQCLIDSNYIHNFREYLDERYMITDQFDAQNLRAAEAEALVKIIEAEAVGRTTGGSSSA